MKRAFWVAVETVGEGLVVAAAFVYDVAVGLLVAGAILVLNAALNRGEGDSDANPDSDRPAG